jgi:hypothetical protein
MEVIVRYTRFMNMDRLMPFIVLICLILLTPLALRCDASEIRKNFADSCIGVLIDKTEKVTEYPAEWKQGGFLYSVPDKEHAYFVVHYTIESIKNIHLIDCGRDFKKGISPVLRSANGKEYEPMECALRGFSEKDQNSTVYHPEVVQGAKGMMLFVLPKNERPTKLSFVYFFKNTWEDKGEQVGKIDIIIDKVI